MHARSHSQRSNVGAGWFTVRRVPLFLELYLSVVLHLSLVLYLSVVLHLSLVLCLSVVIF